MDRYKKGFVEEPPVGYCADGPAPRKGLLEIIGPAIAWPKGVTTGLVWPKAGNPPPLGCWGYAGG